VTSSLKTEAVCFSETYIYLFIYYGLFDIGISGSGQRWTMIWKVCWRKL